MQSLKASAKPAEQRRPQEFQRALERMNPVEAEAAQRSVLFVFARAAMLDGEWAREKARLQAESPYNRAEE